MDAIAAFADHVVRTRFKDLSSDAVSAAKTFITDTCGVGIGGSSGPLACELTEMQETWGRLQEARVWGNGIRLPAQAAAMCNAYQVHNSEFDCVHEEAVVHAMTIVLPVAIAAAERRKNVSGAELITAVAVGVDVAAGLGVAAERGLRFFRPATAGAFGGVAALAKLVGLDQPAVINAFSIAYGQLCGTMQAHTEGSALLAMQMGFNARNAVVACDLAGRDFAGTKNVLEGPFGYFELFETGGSPASIGKELGRRWFITELAHKPYPSGRATHGIIEACVELRRRHSLEPDAIRGVTARVPPLVHHLVGRAPKHEMTANYARLCARYVAAHALLKGSVRVEDFAADAFGDRQTQDLANRIAIEVCETGDPNDLTPIEVEIWLRDGVRHTSRLGVVYGNPAKPLSRLDHLEKFYRNCAAAARPIPRDRAEQLAACVARLEEVADIAELVDLLAA